MKRFLMMMACLTIIGGTALAEQQKGTAKVTTKAEVTGDTISITGLDGENIVLNLPTIAKGAAGTYSDDTEIKITLGTEATDDKDVVVTAPDTVTLVGADFDNQGVEINNVMFKAADTKIKKGQTETTSKVGAELKLTKEEAAALEEGKYEGVTEIIVTVD